MVTKISKFQQALLIGNSYISHIEHLKPYLHQETLHVAVDGGLRHFSGLGILPDLIIGDLDSISPEVLNQYKSLGVSVVRIPSQEETDLEKAFGYLFQQGIRDFVLSGFTGKREDHNLANLLYLEKESSRANIKLITRDCVIYFVNKLFSLKTRPEQLISLVALHPARVKMTRNLKYHLKEELLMPGTRGISNVATSDQISLEVTEGTILLFQFFTAESHESV